jgi:hypothetical protein
MRVRLPDRLCRFLKASLVLWVTALPGCAGENDAPAIDWGSLRMRAIEVEWYSLEDAYQRIPLPSDDAIGQYNVYVRSVDRLFRTRLPLSRLPELAASPKLLALPDDRFTSDILALMIKAFIQSGDRESLVELLSKRCPSLINMAETIEYYLAYHGWRIEDRMHIFAEAYERSQVPETRHALVTAVRRSFAGLGIRGENEAEFLDHAMQWYERGKGRLFVNREYFLNEIAERGVTVYDSYEKHPDLYDNPPPSHEPLFMVVAPGAVGNLGEDPDR